MGQNPWPLQQTAAQEMENLAVNTLFSLKLGQMGGHYLLYGQGLYPEVRVFTHNQKLLWGERDHGP